MLHKLRRLIIDVCRPERIVHRRVRGVDLRLLRVGDTSEAMIEKVLHEEPYTIEWILDMPAGSVFFDVGANMGVYSILAALTGKAVVAFEPFPPNLYLLYRNLQINERRGRHVYVMPLALDHGHDLNWRAASPPRDEPGIANLYDTDRIAGYIPTLAMDAIPGLPKPDYVKIDVDGPEADVIRGGRRTLSNAREIQIERRPECAELMRRMGFCESQNFNTYKSHYDDRYVKAG